MLVIMADYHGWLYRLIIMAALSRDTSVQLLLDSCEGKSILFKLLKEKFIDPGEHLTAVQELPGRLWDVTFKTVDLKKKFWPALSSADCCTATTYTGCTTLVTVLHVPYELGDNVVRYVLGRYDQPYARAWVKGPAVLQQEAETAEKSDEITAKGSDGDTNADVTESMSSASSYWATPQAEPLDTNVNMDDDHGMTQDPQNTEEVYPSQKVRRICSRTQSQEIGEIKVKPSLPRRGPMRQCKDDSNFLEDEPWHSCYAKGCQEKFSRYDLLIEHASKTHPKLKPAKYPCALKSWMFIPPPLVTIGFVPAKANVLELMDLFPERICFNKATTSPIPYSDHRPVQTIWKNYGLTISYGLLRILILMH
ncbi:putative zinc finger CCHC domain-containing protein 3-like [Apostichopus japonicus]|uniref:Putative zinc finger CCHC domain-containing protein 3-like n=1 Tax=Stichopus japonicus TaxID=307972 RepID=A0A2G8K0G2_STIJA|nr:putative zinc finger CCHC domain-containing protein 3-like [Apostichopus japonicus]